MNGKVDAIEEAKAYRRLGDEFNHTQEQLASIMGKDRSVIANAMRLLNLPEEIITQWILRYGCRDSITVHVPEKTMNTHWGMKVSVTTLGEFAHEIYSYWYNLPSKELYTPAREWIDNWRQTCTDDEHKEFYKKLAVGVGA